MGATIAPEISITSDTGVHARASLALRLNGLRDTLLNPCRPMEL